MIGLLEEHIKIRAPEDLSQFEQTRFQAELRPDHRFCNIFPPRTGPLNGLATRRMTIRGTSECCWPSFLWGGVFSLTPRYLMTYVRA